MITFFAWHNKLIDIPAFTIAVEFFSHDGIRDRMRGQFDLVNAEFSQFN
jgi:hypothetical protein